MQINELEQMGREACKKIVAYHMEVGHSHQDDTCVIKI